MQADTLADEITDIADDSSNDWMDRKTKSGDTIRVIDHEAINRSRLRVDARKWIASKLKPKKYGEKLDLTHQGPNGGPIRSKSEVVIFPDGGPGESTDTPTGGAESSTSSETP